ncbi:MAG: methyl-accepting chemotaxis protein [Humidesulfovibrio sp.]|uniref:methyl-accepting chemotaxis protein n=1 Tax=Humidesulfovibrio sp. TaxID=2910988 RepID=UPI0027FF9AD4|nr:methyl-accepting chemotaxis protein [Humidesulfovibrio sp.]MDQ7836194.1 methyl-accepting chemotaxis protein [Humidesulfovibrio sp.]
MLRERLRDVNTAVKLYGLFAAVVAVFVCLIFFYFMPYYEEDLMRGRRQGLADTTDLAFTLMTEYQARVDKGEFTLEEAQKRAATRLKNMRYGNNDYFWINDMGKPFPVMVMHPTVPALDGKVLDAEKFNKSTHFWLGDDPASVAQAYPGGTKNLFQAFVDVCDKAGEGYVRYVWPKPKKEGGVTTELYPKISFVKVFKPWGWLVGTGLYVDDIHAKANELRIMLVWLVGGLVLILSFVVFYLVRLISKPIAQLSGMANRVAAGNLETRESERFHGEMGVLQRSIETMVGTMRDKINEAQHSCKLAEEETQVAQKAIAEAEEAKAQAARATREGMLQAAGRLRGVSQTIGEVSRDISARIDSSRKGSDLQKDRLGETATAMEEMNATVLAVASNAGQAAEAADQAKRKAQEGAGVVNKVVLAIQAVYEQAQGLKTNMGQLGKQADGIGQVMSVINDIADQTNLLALNAAIEAARAGDAGRGFAVVADEVRKLAEKTMTATKEVAQAISDIQKGTRENITNVDQAVLRIEEATGLAKNSGEALSGIVSFVESSSDQVRAIAAASGQQSSASDEINRSLDDINRIASETAEAMSEAVEAVNGLVEQSHVLLGLVQELESA